MKTALAAACLALTVSAAQAQSPPLFLVLYEGRALVGLVDAPHEQAACEREAAAHTANFAKQGDAQFTVRCEERGEHDMIWKLHPEWRK